MNNLNLGLTCLAALNVLVSYGSKCAVQIQFFFQSKDHMAHSSIYRQYKLTSLLQKGLALALLAEGVKKFASYFGFPYVSLPSPLNFPSKKKTLQFSTRLYKQVHRILMRFLLLLNNLTINTLT